MHTLDPLLPMDPNQNNNNSGFDPNTSPAVLASTTPVPPPSDSFTPQPSLTNDVPAVPADPTTPVVIPPTPVIGPSAWSATPFPDPMFSTSAPAPIAPAVPEPVTPEPLTGVPSWASAAPPVPPAWPSASAAPLPDPVSSGAVPSPAPEPMLTFTPPVLDSPAGEPDFSSSPSWPPSSAPVSPVPDTSGLAEPIPSEAVPTDLSHLVGNAASESVTPAYVPVPAMETVAPQLANDNSDGGQAVAATAAPSGGFPKLILAIGVVILVAAMAASAYFILGIGKSQPEQVSVPAEQQPLTTPPKSVLPPTATPQPTPSATGSASLGNLQGATPTTVASPSGTSAIDLLRQQQGR